jgi:hypothetical protein
LSSLRQSNRGTGWQKGRIPAALRQPKFVRDENTTLAGANLQRSTEIEDSVEPRCFEAGILIGKNLQAARL